MAGPPGCCPNQEAAIEMLSRRHAMNIVWLLQQEEPRRFNEIKRELAINPVSLTQRLGELEACGIVERKTFRETPPRVEYRLTAKGHDLVPIIDELGAWARRHHIETVPLQEVQVPPPRAPSVRQAANKG